MTEALRIAATALTLLALAAPTHAAPDDDDDGARRFRDAARLLGAGDLEPAQAGFETLADADPTGAWADDALAEAAGIAERRGDLQAGLRLWTRLVADHPSSRASRRGRARIAALSRAIGADGQWLAVAEQHEALLRAASATRDPTPQVAALRALIAANPAYPRAAEARLWIGDSYLRLGRVADAVAAFTDARARAASDDDRWRAGKGLGDALARGDDLDAAERVYRELLGARDELSDLAVQEALRELDTMRTRLALTKAAWLVLLVGLLLALATTWRVTGSVGRAGRALLRPPIEVMYFVPVALLLVAVAMGGNQLAERAVRIIVTGGLAVTWLAGATMAAARRAGRLGAPMLITGLLVVASAVLAVCYLAVMHDRLLDMLAETWKHGPEGH